MNDILHPQKISASHDKASGSKLKTTASDKHIRHLDISPEQRHQMIAEAAYWRAQKRSFMGGNPENDWYEAETEIDQLFSEPSELHNKPQH